MKTFRILFCLSLLLAGGRALALDTETPWRYGSSRDTLTDRQYSMTCSQPKNYNQNDRFSLCFTCRGNQVSLQVEADAVITNGNEPFSLFYRVDDKEPHQVPLTTFVNNDHAGFNFADAERVARDILGGREILVRFDTLENGFIETTVGLYLSDVNIRKVFADCGAALFAADAPKSKEYTFEQFEAEFRKLSRKNQERLLNSVRQQLETLE